MTQKRKAAANVFMEQQQIDEAPDAEQATLVVGNHLLYMPIISK